MSEDTRRDCRYCGRPITATNGSRGQWARYCDDECREMGYKLRHEVRMASRPNCDFEGCERPARAVKGGYCEAHYYRVRRNGTTSLLSRDEYRIAAPAPARRAPTSDGYVRIHNVDHPLALKDRSVFEHRMVAYDERNGADPSCEWCGVALEWDTAAVDHLDEDRSNNDPRNLYVSCHQCNISRSSATSERFAEGVAVRVLCRLHSEQRAAIVKRVMDQWDDGNCSQREKTGQNRKFSVTLFCSGVQPRGPRGKAITS